jgi:Sigma-70, region 4
MPRLDDLPPDLRATLSLLVDRGKSYAQVAELLDIPESAVRDRAHAALDALAGGSSQSPPLSAAPAAPAASPRSRRTAAIAASPSGPPTEPGAVRRAPAGSGASGGSPGVPVSRRGGALLLGGIALVVVVVVILLTSGGGGGSGNSGGSSTHTGTSASTGASKAGASKSSTAKSSSSKTPTVTNQLTLTPPEASSKAIGIVEVLAEGSQRAFYMAAEHLPPSTGFTYVIWLYNSPSSAEAISKAPKVGSNGRLQGGALLPSNAADYHQILLTHETSEHPAHPGPIVLSGAFSLGG